MFKMQSIEGVQSQGFLVHNTEPVQRIFQLTGDLSSESLVSKSTYDLKPRTTLLGESLDINETSLQLLDEIDPTFWSLETFLQAAATLSSTYFQELSLPQLIKSYTASLCLCTLRKNDHYYEKSFLFGVPFNMTQNLLEASKTHLEALLNINTNTERISEVIVSLSKLGQLLKRFENTTPNERSDLYQARLWPNESSISNVVQYLPDYNQLLPLRKRADRATGCLSNLQHELEMLSSSNHLKSPFSNNFEEFIFNVFTEVENWYAGNQELPMTPRKRSIDLVELDVNNDGQLWSLNILQPVFNSSPLARKKSQLRKRRRFSVA